MQLATRSQSGPGAPAVVATDRLSHMPHNAFALGVMVVCHGVPRALRLAGFLHLLMLIGLIAFGLSAHLGRIYFAGLLPVPFLLFYEHRIARSLDLALINKAFFDTNALIGTLFVAVTAADRLLH